MTDDYTKWVTPLQALNYALRCVGEHAASSALWQRVVGGAIRAAAGQISRTIKGRSPVVDSTPTLIPGRYWADWVKDGGPDFWNGDALFIVIEGGQLVSVRCFQIRLDPEGLRASLPVPSGIYTDTGEIWTATSATDPKPAQENQGAATPPPEVSSMPAAPLNRGGRPPKQFWELLWIEMACQVWAGEIGPESKQSEIQDAMEEWAVANGEHASPATFKNAARALLQALRAKKGKNPSG